MPTQNIGHKVLAVEINGQLVSVSDVAIESGVNMNFGEHATMVQRSPPTLVLGKASIAGIVTGENCSVKLMFPKRKHWEFPSERFVTYEESDERWCRYFGIGREVECSHALAMENARIALGDDNSVRLTGVMTEGMPT